MCTVHPGSVKAIPIVLKDMNTVVWFCSTQPFVLPIPPVFSSVGDLIHPAWVSDLPRVSAPLGDEDVSSHQQQQQHQPIPTDDNGSSVVTIPGTINASSVKLSDNTTISASGDLGDPDQTLSISGTDLTISGAGGNTVTLPSSPANQLTTPDQNTVAVYVNSSGDVFVNGNLILAAPSGDISMGAFTAE